MGLVLPYEILCKIVKHLKDDQPTLLQLNRTSKIFYSISCPLLYKIPQFSTFARFSSFANTLTVSNGLYVRHIDLHMVPSRWGSPNINIMLCNITEKTPNLELLNLDLCTSLSNKRLIKIVKPLHDLRILSVDQCELINDEAVEGLITHCPYIQELYLGGTRITDNSLNLLATQLILLTHLFLADCEYISELGINKVIRECKTLKHIDYRGCYNVVGYLEPLRNHSSDQDMNDYSLNYRRTDQEPNSDDEWTDLEE